MKKLLQLGMLGVIALPTIGLVSCSTPISPEIECPIVPEGVVVPETKFPEGTINAGSLLDDGMTFDILKANGVKILKDAYMKNRNALVEKTIKEKLEKNGNTYTGMANQTNEFDETNINQSPTCDNKIYTIKGKNYYVYKLHRPKFLAKFNVTLKSPTNENIFNNRIDIELPELNGHFSIFIGDSFVPKGTNDK